MVLGSPKKTVSDSDSDCGGYADSKMELNSQVVVRDRHAGTSREVQLTITRGHKKLIAGDQDKPISISSIRQLRTVKVDTDGRDVAPSAWPLTIVYMAWGRVKQLDVDFTNLLHYESFIAVLASAVPAIPIVHLPVSLLTISPLPVAAPLSPRLPLSPRTRVADPLSPRAFGHRPGADTTYTMPPASPSAIRRAAASTKRRRAGPACHLPCLVPTLPVDDDPPVVGAGHPHLQLPDYKLLYDAGKQYDRSRRGYRTAPAPAAPPAGFILAAQG